jgi:pimeloyl-ACP methyl ester carboxylesterase
VTAGTGPALLLIHGGMCRLERWEPLWEMLAQRWRVTAMDRRGRGSSGDMQPYALSKEYDDVTAVAMRLADNQGGPVDVFGHSYGATCALGAAARAPFRRIALYEPPGPQTVPREWVERATCYVAAGQPGRAMASFLTEVIGLTADQVDQLKGSPAAFDVLPIVAATLAREAEALAAVDLPGLAEAVTAPVLLMLGARSPAWAQDITSALAATLPAAEVVILPGQGHEGINLAPKLISSELQQFLC